MQRRRGAQLFHSPIRAVMSHLLTLVRASRRRLGIPASHVPCFMEGVPVATGTPSTRLNDERENRVLLVKTDTRVLERLFACHQIDDLDAERPHHGGISLL